jgi:hypothetical protein
MYLSFNLFVSSKLELFSIMLHAGNNLYVKTKIILLLKLMLFIYVHAV